MVLTIVKMYSTFSSSCQTIGAKKKTRIDLATNSNILIHHIQGESMFLNEQLQIGEV